MDPLSGIIALLRPHAALSKPITARGRWAVRYQAHDAPGFTLILAGQAWVTFEGSAPLQMAQGDFLLIPTTPAFALGSEPGLAGPLLEPSKEAVRHGEQDGEPDFAALGGSFSFERANAPLLLALLPGLIHIPAAQGMTDRMGRTIHLLAEECTSSHPGKDLIVQHMLEVLLVEALRWQGVGHDAASAGLLAGLRDPALARALHAMHADIRAHWTVAQLAKIAGMSRSAFSARFGLIVGRAPMEYLTSWRMAVAKDALSRGGKSLDRIADDIGYESASAFSTAFRKHNGTPPGSFARMMAEA
ncbi:AraC family transcriptional regulator [Novosphingobium sp. SG707]|uniref:AraC family transcriptional regulator n=1 Tax=Novosphingobium sp. SG707 TaxID=2586996 RepID=UPI001444DB13|nr:AraC family transcriptional regulator [Novosphingobium sp. SG707]NKI97969.1 AraC-like DNA-binding protein [Novosphingobium sp. SG707]